MERKVLNVGGNDKAIKIPSCYAHWTHHLLDIDPTGNPDILCDARNLQTIRGNEYDSVYCSHNLEHYFSHDVPKVLLGFHHVLKDDGFAFIKVPDIVSVMRRLAQEGLDVDDVLYQSNAGPISVKDVIYGLGRQIEQSGCDFYAHKTGFSLKSLLSVLKDCGFMHAYHLPGNLEICVIAFKNSPSNEATKLLNLAAFNSEKAIAPKFQTGTPVYWRGNDQLDFVSGLG